MLTMLVMAARKKVKTLSITSISAFFITHGKRDTGIATMTDDEIVDIAAKGQDGAEWRLWYAWRPVYLDQEKRLVWRRWVWRRDVELGWGCSAHQRRLTSKNKNAPNP